MPTFAIISLVVVVGAGLTAGLVAIDLWVRKNADKGKYVVRREKDHATLCGAHIVQVLREKKGWNK